MESVTDNQIRFAVNFAAKALQYEKGASLSTRLTRICCGREGHAPSSWQDTMWWRSRSWGAGSPRVTRFGVHPTTTINIFKGNGGKNEPHCDVYEHGRIYGTQRSAATDNVLRCLPMLYSKHITHSDTVLSPTIAIPPLVLSRCAAGLCHGTNSNTAMVEVWFTNFFGEQ